MGHCGELYGNYTKYTPSLGPRVPPWVTRSLYQHLQKARCVLGWGSVLRAGGIRMETKNALTSHIFAQYLSFLPWKTDRAFVIRLKAGFSFHDPGPRSPEASRRAWEEAGGKAEPTTSSLE